MESTYVRPHTNVLEIKGANAKTSQDIPRHNAYMTCLIWVSVEWDGAIGSI